MALLPLVDTPEYSGSWLRYIHILGSRRQLDYADLYKLDTSDMALPNWSCYAKHRKPGRPLLLSLMLTSAPQLLTQLLLSVAVAVLNYSGLFFLQRILQLIEIIGNTTVGGTPAKSICSVYLDAFGLFVFTLLNMQLIDQAMWVSHHIDFHMKGLFVSELSTKTLNRHAKGSLEGVTGDDNEDSSDEWVRVGAGSDKWQNNESAHHRSQPCHQDRRLPG
ncbi:hypothetical protein DL89DRAFT_314172 [Linderina pennispora]|uniref:Uncharacterized protein n=1 Tax=Linderina pennispora TaxID=61395 RepID=A0A1Y1VVB6_9FUNG|nr:uncharacterized protein DL89DRAFT_314172 [Linderina pennispora]ORX65222.1 hypothetical protein DL89DRAFT_314172 [Linderina pennispora]